MIAPERVTHACIAALGTWQAAGLAAIEREHNLPPRTVPPLRVDHLSGEGFRGKQDHPPVALVGTFGTAERPQPGPQRTLNITWIVAVEISVLGRDRDDTIRRRDWYTMNVAETLLQYLPRIGEPIDAVELADIDLVNGADEQETIAQSRIMLDVTVRDSISMNPGFRPSALAPTPDALYVPPTPDPDVRQATVRVETDPEGARTP